MVSEEVYYALIPYRFASRRSDVIAKAAAGSRHKY